MSELHDSFQSSILSGVVIGVVHWGGGSAPNQQSDSWMNKFWSADSPTFKGDTKPAERLHFSFNYQVNKAIK